MDPRPPFSTSRLSRIVGSVLGGGRRRNPLLLHRHHERFLPPLPLHKNHLLFLFLPLLPHYRRDYPFTMSRQHSLRYLQKLALPLPLPGNRFLLLLLPLSLHHRRDCFPATSRHHSRQCLQSLAVAALGNCFPTLQVIATSDCLRASHLSRDLL